MANNVTVRPSTHANAVSVVTKEVNGVHYPIYATSVVSSGNSSTTALNNGEAFTGDWEDVSHFNNVVVAVKTDQNGTYSIQFSPDGVNTDSTLTRYYRTDQIEAPHKFTVTRRYCRVVFTNDSGSDQTYFRLQVLFGEKSDLNIPTDSVMAQDFDAIATRPTDYFTELTLGRRQGHVAWNKFGYNTDVDTAAPEVVAAFGGAMGIYTTASTYTVVSSDAADDDGSTGCNSIIIYGVNADWNLDFEIVTLDGTTPVVTTKTFISYPNRVAMYLCGTGQVNAGNITITRTTGGATVGLIPAGEGVTQQCIFTIPQNYQFLAEWMTLNAARQAVQNPYVVFKFWVYSAVNNGKQNVFKFDMDTTIDIAKEFTPKIPFPIGEKSIVWIESSTNQNDTNVSARFSGVLIRDVDG